MIRDIIAYLIIIVFSVCACSKRDDSIILKKISIEKNYMIDTIESDPNNNIYWLNIKENKAMDDFNNFIVISFKNKQSGLQGNYKIVSKKMGVRISKDYVALSKSYGKFNWGWYFIENREVSKLPKIDEIIDSLRNNNKDLFFTETNGYITAFKNGKKASSFVYGELFCNIKNVSFDSLDYKLYRVENSKMIPVSTNGDDLFKQKNGLFFIPPPGFGLVSKFSKVKILKTIDSVSNFSSMPDKLEFMNMSH